MLPFAAIALLASSTVSVGQQPPSSALPPSRGYLPGEIGQTLSNGILRIRSAKLACVHNVQIAAQSDGLIQDLLVDEGFVVKKGDTLLNIDSRLAAAELEVATKELEAAVKQAEQTAEVEYAKKASAVADDEYASEKALFEKNSSSFSQANRKKLEAERSRLGIDVAVVKHENEGLAADVAKAKLAAAKVRLELYNVTAPYGGVIVERLRDQGEWIRSGEPVLRLTHMDEMKVEATVWLTEIAPWQLEGAPIKVSVPLNSRAAGAANAQQIEIESIIDFVSTEITSDSVRITAKIANQKLGDTWLLLDGMTANIEIQLAQALSN